MVLRWGKAIRHILGKIPAVIQEGELLVGSIGGAGLMPAGRLGTGKVWEVWPYFWQANMNYITGAIIPVDGDYLGK